MADSDVSDRTILEHAGRYRITLRRVLERSFLNGRAPSNVVQRLREGGLLDRIPLKGRVSCYRLTGKAVAQLSLAAKRAEAPTPVSLQNSLGALWFCYFGPQRRHRLEIAELEEVLGFRPPTGVYCLERDPKPRIYRLYVPGEDTPNSTIRRQVEDRIEKHHASPQAASWTKTRQLALAVLVSEERRDDVNRLLKDLTSPRGAHILVEAAPHPTTLHEWLRRLGETPDAEDPR